MKILVADGARTAALLAGHDVTTVRTIAEARAALLAERHDLLIIGARFDDSRMFDLLREARAARADLRIVCLIPTRTLAPACRALDAAPLLESEATSAAALISAGTP